MNYPDEEYDYAAEIGDEIDHAMDTKAEQEMLADIEHEEYDDPEADAADAADAEAALAAVAYQRRTHLIEVDQSLAYEPNDPKGKHALGWNHD